jgi:rhomboid protease GluP
MREAPVGYQCPECVKQAAGPRLGRRRARLTVGRTGRLATGLILVNLLVFLLEVIGGGSGSLGFGTSARVLFDLGAMQVRAIVVQDQYWRLVTAMFLHAGLIHLAFNMYALYLFGSAVENAFGSARFLATYFVTGILANVTSFALSGDNVFGVSVGASGAVFGLLGAWVAYNYRRRGSVLASQNLQTAMFLIGLNLLLGFSIPGIDNSAHIGGLVSGVAAGAFAEGFGPRKVRTATQVMGFALLVVVGIAVLAWRVGQLT